LCQSTARCRKPPVGSVIDAEAIDLDKGPRPHWAYCFPTGGRAANRCSIANLFSCFRTAGAVGMSRRPSCGSTRMDTQRQDACDRWERAGNKETSTTEACRCARDHQILGPENGDQDPAQDSQERNKASPEKLKRFEVAVPKSRAQTSSRHGHGDSGETWSKWQRRADDQHNPNFNQAVTSVRGVSQGAYSRTSF
jgi:hypothetical protein